MRPPVRSEYHLLSSHLAALTSSSISSLADQITRLQSQYQELSSQFQDTSKPPSSTTTKPNDPSLAPDFRAARTKNSRAPKLPASKSVRFRDNAADEVETAADAANRSALFNQPYRDEPSDETPNQDDLSNAQIHTFHKQVLRDQDDQLETLGRSIGRQRDLSIQMGTELDEQAVMLRDVDEGVDRHQGALDRGNTRIKSITRKAKDNWSWLTIGILIIILVLLIALLK